MVIVKLNTAASAGAGPRPASGPTGPVPFAPLSDTVLPSVDPSTSPWPGEQVTSGGVRLHVRRTPCTADPATMPSDRQEPLAVYVHGLGGSATNWTDLAGLLSPWVGGIAVDLPGFGHSEPVRGFDFALTAHVDALASFLSGLDLPPVHLIGNSMGGAISILVAARHPQLVRTLTLVSPAVPDLRPAPSRLSDPRLAFAALPGIGPTMRRRLAAVPPAERAMQLARLCFADPARIPPNRIAEFEREAAERETMSWAGAALMRSAFGLMRAWMVPPARSMWRTAAEITVPTLVIWGTEDKLVTVRKAPRTVRSFPQGRLLVLPRTGHVAQMERPATVARAVLGMWEGTEAGTW